MYFNKFLYIFLIIISVELLNFYILVEDLYILVDLLEVLIFIEKKKEESMKLSKDIYLKSLL